MSISRDILSASSSSSPRYRTVFSIFLCPSKSWQARRFCVFRYIKSHLVLVWLLQATFEQMFELRRGKPEISGPLILLVISVVDQYLLQSIAVRISPESCRPAIHAV